MKELKYKIGLSLILFVIILAACQQGLIEEIENLPMSIDMAKAWFEATSPEALTLKSGDISFTDPVEFWPDWETAFASQNSTVEIVESQMLGNGSFGFAAKESYSQWAASENIGYLTSLSRIVVLRYKETDEIFSFIMTIIGDREYLEKKQFKQKSNTYLKKDKDFNGLVVFQNLQGEFVNGWRFTNGEVSHKIKLNAGVSIQLKSAIEACVTYEVIAWNMFCVDYYSVGMVDGEADWDNATYNGTSCTDPILSYTLVTECSYIASEGIDGAPAGGYDPNNPPQSDTPTSIPSIGILSSEFQIVANKSSQEVCQLIGGNVLSNYQSNPSAFQNACAIRLSYALNMISGHEIPFTEEKTISGDVDGDSVKEWYFYRVNDIVSYLNAKYGNCILTNYNLLQGKTGIIWQTECGWGDASGHVDVWNGSEALDEYYNVCDEIYIWKN